ncbi:MAG: leucyl/phenylalanyl-tRNA--protein transferase [Bacteroidales bacterium]|nr:leucyl/phenylalanyl-tRNA--protein transferase [Bacteroidales bacterium]
MASKIIFPDPNTANDDGLVAVGGNLNVDTLIEAYSHGIFPWYNETTPILWWSPDPRLVLFPQKLKVTKSLRQKINQHYFDVRFDTCFEKVIHHCAAVSRKDQPGTWITPEMTEAYIKLFHAGYAHSVESFYKNELAGGLYGVALGKVFFGESMFFLKSDASKIALYYLVEKLKKMNFDFIDAQQPTSHLQSLGAEEIRREKFLEMLSKALKCPALNGKWTDWNTN